MAAVNLSSLSTFWSSIKAYILTHFLKKPHILGYVVEQTSITLSEDIRNFSKVIIVLQTNDNIYFEATFSNSGIFFVYGCSTTSAPNAYLKLVRLNVTNNGKTIEIPSSGSATGANEIAFKSNGTVSAYNFVCYIRDIWGIP